jgi:hypothetical protein
MTKEGSMVMKKLLSLLLTLAVILLTGKGLFR